MCFIHVVYVNKQNSRKMSIKIIWIILYSCNDGIQHNHISKQSTKSLTDILLVHSDNEPNFRPASNDSFEY